MADSDGAATDRGDGAGPGVSRRSVLVGGGAAALTGAVTWLATSSWYRSRQPVGAVVAEAIATPSPTPPPVPRATEPPSPAGSAATGGPLGLTVYEYERMWIGNVNDLELDVPVPFSYPAESQTAVLIKVGRRAQGGVGEESDVVAFSNICTHMGCPLGTLYSPEHKVLGPCVCHFTTFDMTKRGIVVIGQATEDLPQIQLELERVSGDIYATGVMGLVYGYRATLDALTPVGGGR